MASKDPFADIPENPDNSRSISLDLGGKKSGGSDKSGGQQKIASEEAALDLFSDIPEGTAQQGGGDQDVPDATIGQNFEDIGRAVSLGVGNLQSAGASVLDMIGLDSIAKATRRDAEFFKEGVSSGLSEEAKADLRKQFITEDEQGNFKLGEGLTDPGTIGLTIAQAFPSVVSSLIPGAAAAKGVQALGAGPKTSAALGFGAAEGGIAGAQSGSSAAREVRNTPIDKLREQSPAFRELEQKTGDPAKAQEELAGRVRNTAFALGGLSAAATGTVPGVAFAPLLRGRGIAKTRTGATAKGFAVESGQEFGQEGLQQASENIAARTEGFDPNRETSEGVPNAAVAGGLAGGPIGGGIGFAGGPDRREHEVRHGHVGFQRLPPHLVLFGLTDAEL